MLYSSTLPGGVVGVVEGDAVGVGGAGQAAQGVVGVGDGDTIFAIYDHLWRF